VTRHSALRAPTEMDEKWPLDGCSSDDLSADPSGETRTWQLFRTCGTTLPSRRKGCGEKDRICNMAA
jgi:hypothetical protein